MPCKCIRIKMSRNEYASWLLSVIGEPCNSQLRIERFSLDCRKGLVLVLVLVLLRPLVG